MATKKTLKESDKKGYAEDADRVNIRNYAIDKQKAESKEPIKPAPSELKKNQSRLTELTTRLGRQSSPSKPVKTDNVSTGGSDSDETYTGKPIGQKKGGPVKCMSSGGLTSRGDGVAQRGKTKCKYR